MASVPGASKPKNSFTAALSSSGASAYKVPPVATVPAVVQPRILPQEKPPLPLFAFAKASVRSFPSFFQLVTIENLLPNASLTFVLYLTPL